MHRKLSKGGKMTNDDILKLWKQIFPNSMMIINKACLGDNYFFKGKLAKDRSESNHGITENDALSYMFTINKGAYKEFDVSLFVKPDPVTEKYLCYGRKKLRKKTIKEVTEEKLLKRFEQVRQLVVDNKDNLINLLFNINDKI